MKILVKQYAGKPTRKQFGELEHLIVVLPGDAGAKSWPDFPHAETLRARAERRGYKGGDEVLVTDLATPADTRVSLGCLPRGQFELLTLARKLVAAHDGRRSPVVGIHVASLPEAEAARAAEAVLAAWAAQAAPLPSYKRKPAENRPLRKVHVFGCASTLDARRVLAEAEGNALARRLTLLPPNELTPGRYRERIAELAAAEGWELHFHDRKRLEKLRCGAFLAVARGNPRGDDGIVELRYRPKARTQAPALALVGKGICFDTGGNNLKPAKHMLGMHEDMAGSAVALGTLLALTRLKFDRPVDCWLALAENLIGPQAYKPNDVVTACDGTTIEVVHTDAEGRMVLADTLALACRAAPRLVIDYATLTGACIYALGTRYSGAFTNRPALIPVLIQAGADSGERVWPFPMDSDYDHELESAVADIRQCTLAGEADHILAARFLNRFVAPDVPWIHLDLASASNKGGLGHIATDTTGFGVRYSLNLLLNQALPEHPAPK